MDSTRPVLLTIVAVLLTVLPAWTENSVPAADTPHSIGAARALMKGLPEAIAVAANGRQYEAEKLYRFTGPVIQMTAEFVQVKNLATNQPLGVLLFGDPRKVATVSLDAGSFIEAIIRFREFRNVPMSSGVTRRLAVFDCLGFVAAGTENYVDTSTEK